LFLNRAFFRSIEIKRAATFDFQESIRVQYSFPDTAYPEIARQSPVKQTNYQQVLFVILKEFAVLLELEYFFLVCGIHTLNTRGVAAEF
jgi:hypothetical protein